MNEEARRCVETIRHCSTGNDGNHCKECPYLNSDTLEKPCVNILFSDAADLIESLSKQLEQTEDRLSELLYYVTGGRFSKPDYDTDDMRRFVDDYNQCVCDECDKCEQLEQVTRERDAAVRGLARYRRCIDCARYDEEVVTTNTLCDDCSIGSKWQWRGVEVKG